MICRHFNFPTSRIIATAFGCTFLSLSGLCHAAKLPVDCFTDAIRKTDSLYSIRTGAHARLNVSKIELAGGILNFNFNSGIEDYPVRPGDEEWLRKTLQANLPEEYTKYKVGRLSFGRKPVNSLAISQPGNNGAPARGIKAEDRKKVQLVRREHCPSKGLSGRHIAIWQSHGRYFNQKSGAWEWQRSPLFQTVEDIFTQSFVVPFLAPMLENAGANVLLPRERDWHGIEIIIDNDASENSSGRIHGNVVAKGWKSAGAGFRDSKAYYTDGDNPFLDGTFLWKESTSSRRKSLSVEWNACIPETGEYAVYVSYASLPGSCTATYTVHAMGGDRNVLVDQSIGGGTWIYLGTWEFEKGSRKLVSLSNFSSKGGVISADAVKIGGGMGNIARGDSLKVSGLPRSVEGARYFMQWGGIPDKVWNQNEGSNDYRDDFMSRGMWVQYISGGSWSNPDGKGLGIPIDLSLGFHTDAGIRDNNGIVGTLSIYTLKCEHKETLPNGESRQTCRELADFIQSQIVSDIRSGWDKEWQRRQLWNRSYSESRTTGVPGVLLELLSHQNFEDMKYGLDPKFRFDVARSCYKGILKYLSMRYNCPYAVQPLPVHCFSAELADSTVVLKWKETEDRLEPTADASSFILYTRIDGMGWNQGEIINPRQKDGVYYISRDVEPDHIHSFRIVAVNNGGLSFPSETLSVGTVGGNAGRNAQKILIVNNFNRVSGPVWFDSEVWGGFDNHTDGGVPYIRDWSFAGKQRIFDKRAKFLNDKECGFGQSDTDSAGKVTAGNSFDYPYIHGRHLLQNGCNFESRSLEAFISDDKAGTDCSVIDLICGKQCQVKTGTRSAAGEELFPSGLQAKLKRCAEDGKALIVSGSYIAHDVFSSVYQLDSASLASRSRADAKNFARECLGYDLFRSYATKSGKAYFVDRGTDTEISFPTTPCDSIYCVESPDAIYPVCKEKDVIHSDIRMRYSDSGFPAAVYTEYGTHKTVAFGFPIETISDDRAGDVFRDILLFFGQPGQFR